MVKRRLGYFPVAPFHLPRHNIDEIAEGMTGTEVHSKSCSVPPLQVASSTNKYTLCYKPPDLGCLPLSEGMELTTSNV